MPSPELIRIRNSRAIDGTFPAIRAFLLRAFSIHTLCPDVDAALDELCDTIHEDGVGLFMVRDRGEWKAMALCQWGSSKFNPVCTVAHFYNEGTKATRDVTIQACIDYACEGGFSSLLGVDVNHQPRAFARLFRAAGPVTYVGAIYQFDLEHR